MKVSQLITLLVCCLLSAALALLAQQTFFAPAVSAPDASSLTIAERNDASSRSFVKGLPADFTASAKAVTPAVVFLRAYPSSVSRFEPGPRGSVTGSGVIIDERGLIATNRHVIEDANRIRIVLGDKREYDATLIGEDESTDLALLKIKPEGKLPYLTFGDSDSLQVGEWVLAVGNPFSLNSTVTAGIVSGKGRSIDVLEPEDRIESFIQTDAAVNPGNSGGALVNTSGDLIGINTAILSSSGRHQGFAFAIPGNLAQRVLEDLRDFGEVRRAVLGAYIQGVNAAQAKSLGLKAAHGVLITGLRDNSPALRGGLKVDDVITAINGTAINSASEFQEQLSRYRPGDRIRVNYVRNGRALSLKVLLRDKNNNPRKLVGREEVQD